MIAIEGEEVFIDVGIALGLTRRDETGVLYRSREIAGRDYRSRVGAFTIRQIGQEISLIEPVMDPGFTIQVGDVATVVPSTKPVPNATSRE